MKIDLNEIISVAEGSIVDDWGVDAIVNSADSTLLGGGGISAFQRLFSPFRCSIRFCILIVCVSLRYDQTETYPCVLVLKDDTVALLGHQRGFSCHLHNLCLLR